MTVGSASARTALLLLALATAPLGAAEVVFLVNDAHVKDQPVEDARILVAAEPGADPIEMSRTDEEGRALLELEPGRYWISYVRTGYVPIGDSETEIRSAGQVVTTTMSMLLEAEGGAARRRVRIVLNWGSDESQVRDADAHVYCVCDAADRHVYFAAMRHERLGHVVELDVDDRDWGGPETVTLSDPEPGEYEFWVHQYSQDDDTLGASDVVVRVFFDDRQAGEFRIPPDLTQRTWKPFRAVTVGADLVPRLERFTDQELEAHADLAPPPDRLTAETPAGPGDFGCALAGTAFFFLVVFFLVRLAVRRRRR